jgi:hypothetical protein
MTQKLNHGILLMLVAIFATAFLAVSGLVLAQDTSTGVYYNMTMHVPGQDLVEYHGAALDNYHSISGTIGGITTRTVLTDGRLYSINPAIKTAFEIEYPEVPAPDETGWANWLIEPGRINPLTFNTLAGVETDYSGEVHLGGTDDVNAVFDNGRLALITFHMPDQTEPVVYTWSNFEESPDIAAVDFIIPEDYAINEL